MQPQAPTPNPNLDFIMQSGQPPKKGSRLPGLGLPKLAVRAIIGVFIIAILIVVYAVLSGGGSTSSSPFLTVLARGQEIIRVSTSVGQLATDVPTQNLAVTTEESLTSEHTQLTTYLATQKIKPSQLALSVDKNTGTDTQMQTASTNGNLNTVFAVYLKQQLQTYAASIQTAYQTAGPHGKQILSDAFNSVQVLLASPAIAKSS